MKTVIFLVAALACAACCLMEPNPADTYVAMEGLMVCKTKDEALYLLDVMNVSKRWEALEKAHLCKHLKGNTKYHVFFTDWADRYRSDLTVEARPREIQCRRRSQYLVGHLRH